MWRDLAIALSLSNLCFIPVWRRLLIPSHSFYYYHVKVPPTLIDYLALILAVLLLGGVFFLGIRLARRANSIAIWKAVQVVFVLILTLAFYNLISQADVPEVRRLFLPLVNSELMIRRLLVTVTLTITVFVTLVALLKLARAVRYSVIGVLILAPLVPITFSQAAILTMRYGRTGPEVLAPPLANEDRKGPRVLWLIFDEWIFGWYTGAASCQFA